MDKDHGGGIEEKRPLHDLAWIYGGMVDSALLVHLVGDEVVLPVEEEDPELLNLN